MSQQKELTDSVFDLKWACFILLIGIFLIILCFNTGKKFNWGEVLYTLGTAFMVIGAIQLGIVKWFRKLAYRDKEAVEMFDAKLVEFDNKILPELKDAKLQFKIDRLAENVNSTRGDLLAFSEIILSQIKQLNDNVDKIKSD